MALKHLHVAADIRQAKTLDTDFYTGAAYFEAAKERIFAPSWQYVGDTQRVAEEGSVYPLTLLEGYLDEPLMLTRDERGDVHCLSNVCTHRGNLVAYEPCKASRLRCRYHGRVFGLDGKFMFMPEFEEVEGFPCADDNLTALPLFRVGTLLFASLNPTLEPARFFGEMLDRIGWMPLDRMEFRADLSSEYHVKANWALYCENFLEGFHIPFVHPSLSAVIDYQNYATEVYGLSNLQVGAAKKGDSCFDLPPSSPDYGQKIAAYYYWVFPNMMFNFYPWGLSFNLVEPRGISETKVTFLAYVIDESKLETGAGSGLDQVELEDEEVVQNVQRGIRSRFYTHGRYSPKREQGPHHFHRLLADFINGNPPA
jgi:choline monooxygenase